MVGARSSIHASKAAHRTSQVAIAARLPGPRRGLDDIGPVGGTSRWLSPEPDMGTLAHRTGATCTGRFYDNFVSRPPELYQIFAAGRTMWVGIGKEGAVAKISA